MCVRGSQCYAQMQNSSIDSLLSHQLKIVCCLASSFLQDLLGIDSKKERERERERREKVVKGAQQQQQLVVEIDTRGRKFESEMLGPPKKNKRRVILGDKCCRVHSTGKLLNVALNDAPARSQSISSLRLVPLKQQRVGV